MAVEKEVVAKVKLQIGAGKAVPGQQLGPALGQHGINIKKFCDEFNAQTKEKAGYVIPVEISVYKDKSFSFILKTPPVSDLIKKSVSVDKGSSNPKAQKVGVLTMENVKKIAEMKMPDLNTVSLESAIEMVKGTAKSMGIEVK